jgi:hypothetical protein
MILSIPKTSIAFVRDYIFFLFLMFCKTSAQEISGKQLLEKQSITTILRATGIIFKVNFPWNEHLMVLNG